MKSSTIVVVGAGHAGLHAVKALEREIMELKHSSVRIVIVDKEPYHVRKVMLFKAIVDNVNLNIPLEHYFGPPIEIVQAELTAIDEKDKRITVAYPGGQSGFINYDKLVLAVGSEMRQAPDELGGVSLSDADKARTIREEFERNIRKAKLEHDAAERGRLLSAAVVGAGITGIETSAELAVWMKRQAKSEGLDSRLVQVKLINAQSRLMQEAPRKVGAKLESELNELGVTVFHEATAERFDGKELLLKSDRAVSAGFCIWTLGMKPNPMLRRLNLPLDANGKVIVDHRYGVKGHEAIYAIGDCAKITDPVTGKEDDMTCKEGIAQAKRLAVIMKAELDGTIPPGHRSYPKLLYSIGLGPDNGLLWEQKDGIDHLTWGKEGGKIKQSLWDGASLLNKQNS